MTQRRRRRRRHALILATTALVSVALGFARGLRAERELDADLRRLQDTLCYG